MELHAEMACVIAPPPDVSPTDFVVVRLPVTVKCSDLEAIVTELPFTRSNIKIKSGPTCTVRSLTDRVSIAIACSFTDQELLSQCLGMERIDVRPQTEEKVQKFASSDDSYCPVL